mmetsp:Transcript_1584/g.2862  ORF Transcript_1584/g.2862 Transcript_1584/m.2862 type:complete len:226 (+) Transcript_1584:418-1095(+)
MVNVFEWLLCTVLCGNGSHCHSLSRLCCLPFLLDSHFCKNVQRHRLWTLNWKSKCPRPNILRHHTQGSGDCKHNCIVVLLRQPIEAENLTTMSVHIGVRIFHFSHTSEQGGKGLVASIHELEERITLHMLQSEFALQHVARVCLAQHCMTKSWDDFPCCEGLLSIFCNDLLGWLNACQVFLHLQQPSQALLVRQSMKGAGQTVESCTPCIIWVTQCRAYQMCCVR